MPITMSTIATGIMAKPQMSRGPQADIGSDLGCLQ